MGLKVVSMHESVRNSEENPQQCLTQVKVEELLPQGQGWIEAGLEGGEEV